MAEADKVEERQPSKATRENSSVSDDTKVGDGSRPDWKYGSNGNELVPQPSDDPRDPLVSLEIERWWCMGTPDTQQNWSMAKKVTIFGIMCFGTFVGIASAVANVLATPVQAKDWGVTPEEAAYSVIST